ncbi:autorepressor SdpR family transcription factor [Bacillus sp. Marseille-P3800]|uniref:autorepressor SdpR family transcription factor n=1 Tax=Bacillus sp. Marseille-P3800 TaxID=2014782 RepID=UPI000C089107|nr:autorepressor SdpR family transcription factor [Bacillus sp. Marseille-P3800]
MNELFKALDDDTRRNIISLLGEQGRLSAGQLAEQLGLTKPNMSHHLSLLHRAGLVHRQKEGQFVYYTLNTTVFQDLLVWVHALINKKGEK